MAIGRRPRRGAAGPTPGPPSRGRPEPQAGPATAYRLQPRAPAQAAVARTGRAWTHRGGGAEASSPAGPPRSSASPPCPLPAPPASDWLSGPQPAQHWPARLSLDLAPPPAGAGHRVSVLGDHPSTRGLRRSRVESRGWPSPSCTRTPAELHLRGDRFILPKCRRTLEAPGEHWTGSLWTCVELWLAPLLLCDLERDVPLPGLGFLFRWALLRGLLVNYTHPGLGLKWGSSVQRSWELLVLLLESYYYWAA